VVSCDELRSRAISTLWPVLVAVVACSVDLAELRSTDPTPIGGAGGTELGGTSGSGASSGSGGTSFDATADVPEDTDPPPDILCSVNFEAADCFGAYLLAVDGSAYCGTEPALGGKQGAALTKPGGSVSSASCGDAPPTLWLEVVFRRNTAGTVWFELGGDMASGESGLVAAIGSQGNSVWLECMNGVPKSPAVSSAPSIPYVLTMSIDQNGKGSMWQRPLSSVPPRGAPDATLDCPPPTVATWAVAGTADVYFDDVRVASTPNALLFK